MPVQPCFSVALAGLLAFALPACAGISSTMADTAGVAGVDLGPSTRIPAAQVAMAGTGHEAHRLPGTAANIQQVHNGKSDAHATGSVNAVDAARHRINLSHGPIPALGWPAMTMDFPVAPSVDLARVMPGSRVKFSLEKDKGGTYRIQSVQPAGAER
jgi:Cu(I)/Ag(I) efflux system periplasmic protein CusF